MKLPEALAYGGTAENGYQLLKEESIQKMTQDYLTPFHLRHFLEERFQKHGMEGYSYGLGVRTREEDLGTSPVGEFGWDGAAGGYILMDPVHHLTMGYLQHVMNMGIVYEQIHPMFQKALYASLECS